MSVETPVRATSVRPPDPDRECGGRDAMRVGVGRCGVEKFRAVHPVEEDAEEAELEATAEEEVTCLSCLPTPYQPTRSEYIGH